MQNWVSFDGNSVQGYLPDQVGFDQSGKQASKTSFMPGSAEEMVANAIDLLEESYAAVSKYVYPDQRSRAVFSGAKAVLRRLTVGQRLADRHAFLAQSRDREPDVRLEPLGFRALEVGRRR